MLGIEPARDPRKYPAHIARGQKNRVRGDRIARFLAGQTPARLGGEEDFLAPPPIIEGEMWRTGLLQTGDIKNPCAAIRMRWAIEPRFFAKLRQTEGTAIVVKSRIRHPSILSRLAF
jgi:hypothetical protein